MKSRSQGHDIHRPRSRHDTNIVNIEGVSLWWCLYALSNT